MHTPHTRSRARRGVSLIALLGLLVGCVAAPPTFDRYREAIQDFQAATEKTADATVSYLIDLNAFERRLELQRLRADPQRPLDIPNRFLHERFDPGAIRARIRAFEMLKDYTEMLAALADSDASQRWSASVGQLAASAATLRDNIREDETAPNELLEPLSRIVDVAGQRLIDAKRAEALDAAIRLAAPAIDEISQLLRDDIETILSQRLTVLNDPLIDIVAEYEALQAESAFPQGEGRRLALLDELEAVLERNAEIQHALRDLRSAMDGFDSAHSALLTYAQSDKTPHDLDDLLVVVKHYQVIADALATAVADGD